jgi:hypothetical protein
MSHDSTQYGIQCVLSAIDWFSFTGSWVFQRWQSRHRFRQTVPSCRATVTSGKVGPKRIGTLFRVNWGHVTINCRESWIAKLKTFNDQLHMTQSLTLSWHDLNQIINAFPRVDRGTPDHRWFHAEKVATMWNRGNGEQCLWKLRQEPMRHKSYPQLHMFFIWIDRGKRHCFKKQSM